MSDASNSAETATTPLAVSANEAAAWMTGRPDYGYHEHPECPGVCFDGHCALSWHHGRGCCFVAPADYGYRHDGDYDRPYGAKTSHHHDDTPWYCWH